MQVFNTWLERSQPNWNGHRLMNRAEPKATIFVNDPLCNLSDPNIAIIMGSFVDTATSLQRAYPIEL